MAIVKYEVISAFKSHSFLETNNPGFWSFWEHVVIYKDRKRKLLEVNTCSEYICILEEVKQIRTRAVPNWQSVVNYNIVKADCMKTPFWMAMSCYFILHSFLYTSPAHLFLYLFLFLKEHFRFCFVLLVLLVCLLFGFFLINLTRTVIHCSSCY